MPQAFANSYGGQSLNEDPQTAGSIAISTCDKADVLNKAMQPVAFAGSATQGPFNHKQMPRSRASNMTMEILSRKGAVNKPALDEWWLHRRLSLIVSERSRNPGNLTTAFHSDTNAKSARGSRAN
jgi:hypothetical protein